MSQHTNSGSGRQTYSGMSGGSSTSGFGQEDGGVGGQVRQQGSAGLDQVKGGASKLTKKARKQVSRYVDAQKSTVTGQIDTLAKAIRQAGEELGRNEQAQASQLVTQVAAGLEGLSRSIDEADLSDVLDSVRRFGRSNPAVFIGGAVLAGMALARFARASGTSGVGQGAQNWQSGSGGSSGSGDWRTRSDAQFGAARSSSPGMAGGGAAGSFRTGGAASYGGPGATGAGALGTAAAAAGATGAGGFGRGGVGAGGSQGSFAPSSGRAGDAPQPSQGYAGGGMDRDPIQSSTGSSRTSNPSSATEPSVGASISGGGLAPGSISTGENT